MTSPPTAGDEYGNGFQGIQLAQHLWIKGLVLQVTLGNLPTPGPSVVADHWLFTQQCFQRLRLPLRGRNQNQRFDPHQSRRQRLMALFQAPRKTCARAYAG